jgi:hypothetical protein
LLVEVVAEADDVARSTPDPRVARAARDIELGEQVGVAGAGDDLADASVVRALGRGHPQQDQGWLTQGQWSENAE